MHQVSETTLLIVKFRFGTKKSNFPVKVHANFLESSHEQRTKFVHFACVTFAQYCI